MTISLDGSVADQNGDAGRVYPNLAALRCTAYMQDAIEQTGAVLMGKRAFGDHPPSIARKQDEHLSFTFVTDGVASAVAQAKAAARDKTVQVVGGVSIAQQLLDARLVDEIHVDIMPVFFRHRSPVFGKLQP
jgi:dihydrofolate reductase